jgi:hypothetical protein
MHFGQKNACFSSIDHDFDRFWIIFTSLKVFLSIFGAQCFLAKNDPKCMFFAEAKAIESNLKGVKMAQNRSKP